MGKVFLCKCFAHPPLLKFTVLRAVYVLNPESTLSLWIEGLLLHLDTCQHVVERVEDAGSIGVLAWSWLADALDRWAGRGRSSDDEADMTRVYEMLVARYWWSAVHFASPWVIQRAGMTGQPWIEVETARARVAAYVLGTLGVLWCRTGFVFFQ